MKTAIAILYILVIITAWCWGACKQAAEEQD